METLVVTCIPDNKFEQNRRVVYSCYNEFLLEKENVFYEETIICEDYVIGQYYTLCPHCGYIILLDENKLSKELKEYAKKTKEEDPLQFRKNSLKSELIHLEKITPKVKARVYW